MLYLVRLGDDVHRVIGRTSDSRSVQRTRGVVHPLQIFVDRVQWQLIGTKRSQQRRRQDRIGQARGTGRTAGRAVVVGGQQLFDRRVHRRFTDLVVSGEQSIVQR